MNQIEVIGKLMKQWPHLRIINESKLGNTIMADVEYYVPYLKEAEKLINFRQWWKLWIKPKTKPGTMDCDDMSRHSMSEVRQAFNGDKPLSYGRVGGRFPKIGQANHMQNVMVCQDGLLLYDYENEVMWQPTADDKVWFCEM